MFSFAKFSPFVLALVLAGCGTSASRVLTTITVSPAAAQASAKSGGVQFVATGTFSAAPTTVTPLIAVWSFTGFTAQPQPSGITLDPNGFAQCTGFVGSVNVYATHPSDPNGALPLQISPSNGEGFVTGAARLTCN